MHSRLRPRIMCQEGNMITSANVAHNVTAEAITLGGLLQLGRRARQASSSAELAFIAVNETFQLTPYRQAALWLSGEGVVALSGVTNAEENAPYVLWLNELLKRLAAGALMPQEPQVIDSNMLTVEEAAAWNDWLPACGVWLPLPSAQRNGSKGGLLLVRDRPWSRHEIALLAEWIAIFAHAYASVSDARWVHRFFRTSAKSDKSHSSATAWWSSIAWVLRTRWLLGGVALAAIGSLPVSLTVLAPAELVPLTPAVIRAPLDGVVDHVLVTPNQHVVEGTPLFEFDRANIQNRLEVAIKELATEQADFVRPRSRRSSILKGVPSSRCCKDRSLNTARKSLICANSTDAAWSLRRVRASRCSKIPRSGSVARWSPVSA